MILGAFMLLNIIWAFVYNENTVFAHLWASAITIISGLALYLFTKKDDSEELLLKESYFTVTMVWVIISLFSTLPYFFTGTLTHFPDLLFETVSGITATGSTVLTDVEALPNSVLFWRSMTHWIGGMGIIVLVVAILPLLRIGGYNLFKNEASGISYEKLAPKTAGTAKRLWGVYLGLTLALIILLLLGGMTFFEALNYSFSTIATGGFAIKNSSVGEYSAYIQYVIIFFMFLSGVNFYLHYYFIKGNFKKVFRNVELKTYISIILISTSIVGFFLIKNGDYSLSKSFRDSLFQVVSIISTTGFTTTNYLDWPLASWSVLFLLMFVGASVGSTGGGVKVIRHIVNFKNVVVHFKKMLHPNSVSLLKINGEALDDDKVNSIISFLVLYMLTFIVGSIILIFLGEDLLTSVGAVAANMGGVGPGIGLVGPEAGYSEIHNAGKITLSILMIAGRLELSTVIILFTSIFWKN